MEQTTMIFNNVSNYDSKVNIFDTYIAPTLFLVIIFIGVLGNGLLIYTILAQPAMRTVANIFLLSLAIGDLMVIVVNTPLRLTVYLLHTWISGSFFCYIYEFLIDLSQGVSIFTLTALAGDRFVAIVLPMSALTWSTKRKTIIIAVLLWLVAIVFALPDIVTSRLKKATVGNTIFYTCSLFGSIEENGVTYHPYVIARRVVNLFVYFVIPFIIIAVMYIAIAVTLSRRSSTVMLDDSSSTANVNMRKQIAARKYIAKMVLVIVLIFFVCWVPRHFFIFYFSYSPYQYTFEQINVFFFLSQALPFINSCINPPVLYFMRSEFKRYFDHYLFGCCCPSKRLQPAHRQSDGQLTSSSQVKGNCASVG